MRHLKIISKASIVHSAASSHSEWNLSKGTVQSLLEAKYVRNRGGR
jgi:hypothetical protein